MAAKASQPLLVLLSDAQNKIAKDFVAKCSREVVAEVQALIDSEPTDKSVNAVWQDVQDVFAREGIGNPEAIVLPAQCIFHTANRGSLGGNSMGELTLA